jgi:hypothetical protein
LVCYRYARTLHQSATRRDDGLLPTYFDTAGAIP